MSIRDRYPALGELFDGYFHQDWMLDDPTPEAAIGRYLQAEPTQALRALEELTDLLAEGHREETLRELVFFELHCYYDPTAHGGSVREWLESVKSQLETPPYRPERQ
jgi:contact-dependent growth inhibition (CDI) system CdiI-like immunity protein